MPLRTLLLLIALFLAPLQAAAQAANIRAGEPVLLVASPELRDPNFAQTVVLVIFPKDGGPLGVILNRPTPFTLGKLFPSQPKLQARTDLVYFGGPIRLEALMFLYRDARPLEGATAVLDDLYLSGNGDLLDQLLAQPGKRFLRYYVGYSGWAPVQLQLEVAEGAWYVLPADLETILNGDPKRMWRDLLLRATAVKT
jgi:putative transcriptional regulator